MNNNDSNIFFSVVVPVYDRFEELIATLNSVYNQSFTNFECLIVDDGSSDAGKIQSIISGLSDRRFIYMRQPNKGAPAARNLGITAARGDYIALLDSDDIWKCNKLQSVYNSIMITASEALYHKVKIMMPGGKSLVRPIRGIRNNENMGEYLFGGAGFCQTSSIVCRRDILSKVLFDEDLKKGQDLDLCIRLQSYGINFFMIDDVLSEWVNTSKKNRISSSKNIKAVRYFLEKNSTIMTRKSISAYKSTILAPNSFREQPFSSLVYISKGILSGSVSARATVRALIKCFS